MESERVTWEFIGIIIVIVMKSIGAEGRREEQEGVKDTQHAGFY